MLGLSLDRWFSIANTIYIGAVVVAAVATFAIYQISQEISARDMIEKQAAKDQVEIAKSDAAKANERAARLENEAAQAKLEQEKLKASLAWRTLSKDQADKLSQVAAKITGSVNLRYTDGDPEALFFAIQIGNLLSVAKWNVAPGSVKYQNALAFGIHIEPDGSHDAALLRDALSAAAIPYTNEPTPPIGSAFNVSTIPGAPTLTIGSRLPAVNQHP